MRCIVDIGKVSDPNSVAYRLGRKIEDDQVYTTVKVHLTQTGLDLDGPASHVWMVSKFVIGARCSDVGAPQVGPIGKQPFNYLVLAEITDRWSRPWVAKALEFHHEDEVAINTP